MIVCGIDPGVTGAVCFIKGKEVTLHKMPDTEEGILDIILNSSLPVSYYLEKVHASPQMGASTAWTFCENYTYIRTTLKTFFYIDTVQGKKALGESSFKLVIPQHWQAAVDCFTGGDKHVSFRRAKELFPDLKGLTLKTADAALIAYYGWLKEGKPI